MKKIIEKLFPSYHKRKVNRKQEKEFEIWGQNNFPVPPPHLYKQNTITEYQKNFKCSVLIETGTFRGEMVEAQKNNFEKIISIELATLFYERAKKKFAEDKHIQIFHGDSGQLLPGIVSELAESAIFWLDGHYSGGDTAKGDKECPILEEINAILVNSKFQHVLLIDDARCFIGKNDYPTISELSEFIKRYNSNYEIDVKHDIIRATCNFK